MPSITLNTQIYPEAAIEHTIAAFRDACSISTKKKGRNITLYLDSNKTPTPDDILLGELFNYALGIVAEGYATPRKTDNRSLQKKEVDHSIFFRAKSWGHHGVLLTAQNGDWIHLSQQEYGHILSGDALPENLTEKLQTAGILIDKTNIQRVAEKQQKKLSFLSCGTTLHIVFPTRRCNHDCLYCHSGIVPPQTTGYDMDLTTARKTVDFILQSPTPRLTLEINGGEPLLAYPVVREIITYAKKQNRSLKKDICFSLVSNLSLLTEDMLSFFEKENVSLSTSLDGPRRIHDKNRRLLGSGSSHKKITEKITWMREQGFSGEFGALMVTTRHSLGHAKAIVNEYRRLGFNRIWIQPVNYLESARKNWKHITYSSEEFLRFWKQCLDYILFLNKKGESFVEMQTELLLQKILTDDDPNMVDLRSPCGAAIGQLAYEYNGDIYSCDEGRHFDLFRLGNVFEDSYPDVVCSPDALRLVAASINDCHPCDGCAWKPYCGLCPVCTYAETGTIIPCLPQSDRCAILNGQFDHVFRTLVYDGGARKIFHSWLQSKRESKTKR